MDARAINGNALPYVLVQPDGFSAGAGYPLVVLLHGFGASMQDLASLAPAIDPSGYVYAFPNAPYRVDLGGGAAGFSWALGRPGVETPPSDAPSVDDLLDSFFTDLIAETGVTKGQIVLAGFSQGGGLTLRYGLPRADTFAGLAVLSGAFRDAEEVRPSLPPQRTQPIFIGHGAQDPLISLDRSHETRAFLEAEGYAPLYHEYDMAHEISPAELADLTPWLHATLPPKAAPAQATPA